MNFLLDQVKRINKAFYTIADLEKLSASSRQTLYVQLNRLVRSGKLVRLRAGMYVVPERSANLELAANALYAPSYLSFECALSRYGLISQIPATLTFATVRKSKTITLGTTEVVYRKLKPSLFFGYVDLKGLLIAEPEKSFLDMLYMLWKGNAVMPLARLDLKELNRGKIKEYAERFPPKVAERAKALFAAR